MKLRSQIFFLLFALGLAPLLIGVAVNVPLVFDKIERFYHDAYLQELRTGFRDLDQHITRRQEIVRLFAKLPDPGITGVPGSRSADQLEQQRKAYVDWANRVLFDQQDITQVLFINRKADISFYMQRNFQTGQMEAGEGEPDLPSADFFYAGLKLSPGAVLTSPISFNHEVAETAPNRVMTLHFISPLISSPSENGVPELDGLVVVNMDVGGLAHAYRGIYWVQNNGEYLSILDDPSPRSTAFTDFPGLDKIFARGKLGLWEKDGQQIFWLPLFPTVDSGPLWVGRSVDPSPISDFRRSLEIRVAAIVTGLLVFVLLVARLIAMRTGKVSQDLSDGIARVLEHSEPVEFSWKRPSELKTLGDRLTSLARKHASDTRSLRDYAHELEESNLYKSQFLANVSHELRTPLNSILLLSKILSNSKDGVTEESHRQARVIHDAGRDLRTLIDSVLDLSRIEAGEAELHVEPVDLRALLDELQELMLPQFREKGLSLELDISADAIDRIDTDRDKLRQILVNFLSNALKFTDKGGAVLRLASNPDRLPAGSSVAISVSDSGIGIPAEKQSLVFEAFKQVDGSSSRRYGGTGLGLTISRELASLINGRIEISSDENSGSTFTILLPEHFDTNMPEPARETVDGASQAASAADAQSEDIPSADYRGHRVLLVDDDLRNLLALTPLLEHWGLQVTAAGDGREALETLHDDKAFSLVLMDLMMPEMDGIEAIRQIRLNPHWQELPVVALTARAADSDRQQAIDAGASDYLSKPVEPQSIKRILDEFLAPVETS